MNIIKTKAPIGIEELKIYFQDKDTFYHIDYKESELKGEKLLTYLSNLELPCDLIFSDAADQLELLKEYFHFNHVLSVQSLELRAIDILFQYKGILEIRDQDFIEANKDIIAEWTSKLDSLTLYNMWMIDDEEFKDFVKSHPENETASMGGINFVSLLKHEIFYSFYNMIGEVQFYSTYFNEYMFKGNNLYYYWANENNPMFLLTWGIATGNLNNEEYTAALKADDSNVPFST